MANATTEKARIHFEGVIAEDAELAVEMDSLRNSEAVNNKAFEIAKDFQLPDEAGFESADFGRDYQEAVILATGRPVLAIVNNNTQIIIEEAESEVWRERLTQAETNLTRVIPAIGRIELVNHHALDWCGTGWLVDENILVTNRHVAELFSRNNGEKFEFRLGLNGKAMNSSIDFLEEAGQTAERVFMITEVLSIEPEPGPDIAFMRIALGKGEQITPITLGKEMINGSRNVAIIGYPAKDSRMPDIALMEKLFSNVFDKKRLAPGMITGIEATTLTHDCSTLGGCSGSPVIDLDSGNALGIHFSGRYLKSNYAVPAHMILEGLDRAKKGKKSGAIVFGEQKQPKQLDPPVMQPAIKTPTVNAATYQLNIPLKITVELGDSVMQQQLLIPANQPPAAAPEEFFTEGTPADYEDRVGYVEKFLGNKFAVPLPKPVTAKVKKEVLTWKLEGKTNDVLKYQHFSVLMNKVRRQCFYSAVNIDGSLSKKQPRVGWRKDPRIPGDAQILKECYGDYPKYSRGHMTRREDPVWGTPTEAARGNADSMCVTNTTPQMQSFNSPIWLGLEDYALSNARKDNMKISVFTGPVFRPDDKIQWGVRIPVLFWKIIVFVHDKTKKLTATGYMMSQEDHFSEEEFVFGEYKTAQVTISSIEEQIGFSFGKLAELDPLGSEESVADPVRPISSLQEIRF